MLQILSEFFSKKGIRLFAPLPLELCRIQKPQLLERVGIAEGSVCIFAVPYLTPAYDSPDRNLSAYAVGKDYHRFFSELFDELLPLLRENCPDERFAAFSDHSPIHEKEAAAMAGLGRIGQNGLLITEEYSSYIFLGEIVTTLRLPAEPREIAHCEGCGRCKTLCPAESCGGCLSALTQKKGALSEQEAEAIRCNGSLWGCDLCQEVCPHTERARAAGAIYTPIPYFYEDPLPHLTEGALDAMSDASFAERAYAWRGRETVRRNLKLMKKTTDTAEDRPNGEKGAPC